MIEKLKTLLNALFNSSKDYNDIYKSILLLLKNITKLIEKYTHNKQMKRKKKEKTKRKNFKKENQTAQSR